MCQLWINYLNIFRLSFVHFIVKGQLRCIFRKEVEGVSVSNYRYRKIFFSVKPHQSPRNIFFSSPLRKNLVLEKKHFWFIFLLKIILSFYGLFVDLPSLLRIPRYLYRLRVNFIIYIYG